MENSTAQPNIVGSVSPQGGLKWFTPRNIFIVLGTAVLIEVILAGWIIVSKSGQFAQAPTGSNVQGKIALLADKKEVAVGDTITISVDVTSPAQSIGIDAVVKFDPEVFEVSDEILLGTIFPQYPLASVDPKGLVRISGIATLGTEGFLGNGTLGTLKFKALKMGNSVVSLEFEPGSTADSNIVSAKSDDVLQEVENLEVVVK